jgi:hypothetical protein
MKRINELFIRNISKLFGISGYLVSKQLVRRKQEEISCQKKTEKR